jgi:hypothetical protein
MGFRHRFLGIAALASLMSTTLVHPALAFDPPVRIACRTGIQLFNVTAVSNGQNFGYHVAMRNLRMDGSVRGTLRIGRIHGTTIPGTDGEILVYPADTGNRTKYLGQGNNALVNSSTLQITYDRGQPGTMTIDISDCSFQSYRR